MKKPVESGMPPAALAALLAALSAVLATPPLGAQAVKVTPAAEAPPPPVAHEGLIPGVSTLEDAKAKLGEPAHQAPWYALKLLYPSRAAPGRFDAIHIQGGRRIGTIERAGAPAGCEDFAAVAARLGEPEFLLEFSRQSMADYSARGVRFTFDEDGRTIGAAFFPHGYPRVHAGERRKLSLRSRRPEGPRRVDGPVVREGSETVVSESPGSDPLLCGAAEADISPVEPGSLGPILFQVHDPLRARAAVFTRGELTVAIVGADIFGMQKADVDAIEARLRERGVDHLVLAMSHVHTAGDPIGIYGFYPAEYVKRIQRGVEEAVAAALAAAGPVKEIRGGADELSLAGARVEGLFRNARNPGIVDPQVAVVEALGAGGKPIVTIAHFACHPEGIDNDYQLKPLEVSADFPGYLCDEVRKATGAQAIFLNGALGGMVTGDTRARTHEEAAGHGRRLAAEVLRIRASAAPGPLSLSCVRRRVEIPVTNPKFIAFEMVSRKRSYRGRLATEMFHIRLGRAELLTVPGELLPELSFEILERMSGRPSMVVGLTNDQLGYIIPAYDFRAGEYEESMSPGPAAGPVIVEAARRMLGGD